MKVEILSAERMAKLRDQPFSYDEVGHTRTAPSPAGFRSFTASTRLPAGYEFGTASRDLLQWQVPLRSGIGVTASSLQIAPGVVAELSLGPGRLAVTAPVRIVYLIDEADRLGFGYGTLPRHPEAGEEAFLLTRGADGNTTFTISAFSRPATLLTRVSGPIGRQVQHAITRRYLRALAAV